MGAPDSPVVVAADEDAQTNDVAKYAAADAQAEHDANDADDDGAANDQAAQASQVSHAAYARIRHARAAELAGDQQQHQ